MPTMLEHAISYIRAGEIEKARPFLINWLRQNPDDENAWLWLAKCVTDSEQKRYCLEKVLKINPQNQYAIRELKHLTRPVSPPTQPKASQVQPPVQTVPKPNPGDTILRLAIFGIGIFLVLLFLYAWWLAR